MKTALLIFLALFALGCGAGAAQGHTAAITLGAGVHRVAFASVSAARAEALDRVEAEHPEPGPERSAALDAEAARWRPVGSALDAYRSALFLWLEAVSAAAEDDDLWDSVLPIVARVVALWGDVVRLAGTFDLELPELPGAVTALAGAQ